jgi:3'-phosphoadenosine 5'-phosphosulfate sulfotransferase (PAPS reductase)/FAD synthetase
MSEFIAALYSRYNLGMLSVQEIRKLSEEFETKTPQEIIQWAVDTFWPEIAMSSSFQTQSMPLLHMVTQPKAQPARVLH